MIRAMTPEMLCADRQAEQRAAAAVIGAKEVMFLSYSDGELMNTLDVRRAIVREIRRFKPRIVVTCDPTTYSVGAPTSTTPIIAPRARQLWMRSFQRRAIACIFRTCLERGWSRTRRKKSG